MKFGIQIMGAVVFVLEMVMASLAADIARSVCIH